MNTFFRMVAWAGLLVFIAGAIISLSTSYTLTSLSVRVGLDFGNYLAFLFGIVGLVLMQIGILISVPRHFWLLSIIAGLFYIASFFDIYLDFPERIRYSQIDIIIELLGVSVLPGLIAIIDGVWLKRTEGKKIIEERP